MSELIDALFDIILDAFKDTLTLIPFLYVTYLAMEALEHSAAGFSERVVVRAGKAGPVLGGLLGALPQCGFSAMAATLYAGRVVTMGTVIAVFLSTSDEMLPIFISEGAPVEKILAIVGTKVLIGMVAGLIIDAVIRLITHGKHEKLRISDLCAQDGCDCEEINEVSSGAEDAKAEGAAKRLVEQEAHRAYEADGEPSGKDHAGSEGADSNPKGSDHASAAHVDSGHACYSFHRHHHDGHSHSHGHVSIWKSALIHTVQVTVFIFLISLVLDGIIEFMGEDALAQFMNQNAFLSIFASGLIGLIPNCGASVAISDLYLQGALGAPAMMAGLLIGAGVGLLVLFRSNRPVKNTVFIISLLYAIGVGVGLVMQVLALGF